MKLTVDGMIIHGTPEEVLEFQELNKRRQNEKGWDILNKPIPMKNESPSDTIENHLKLLKRFCDYLGYEFLAQVKLNENQIIHYQSKNMLLDSGTIFTQKQLLDIKLEKLNI